MRTGLTLAVLALVLAATAGAKELRFAFQGDADSMDPYTLNETFTLDFLGNIYEGPIRRGPDLPIEPAMAAPVTARTNTRSLALDFFVEGVSFMPALGTRGSGSPPNVAPGHGVRPGESRARRRLART